jgi:RecG-like helicase
MSKKLPKSVQFIKGVGPKWAKVLSKLDIYSITDLFYYFPRNYEDRSEMSTISQVKPGQSFTLKVKVIKKELKNQKLEVDSFFRELYKMNNFNKKIKNHSVSMSPFYNSITNNNLNIFKKLYNILNDYNNGKNPLLLVGFKHVEYVNMINDINEKYESIDNKIKNILIFFMNLKKELYFHNQKIEPNKNYINNESLQ